MGTWNLHSNLAQELENASGSDPKNSSWQLGDRVRTVCKGKRKYHQLVGEISEVLRGGKRLNVQLLTGDDDVVGTHKEFTADKLEAITSGEWYLG